MKRLPGPSDEELIAIIKDGPIDSWLLGERLGCSAKMAGSRCSALQKAGAISVFCYRVYKRGATTRENSRIWYIPGCGIDPAEYQGQVMASRLRAPCKKTSQTAHIGVNKNDLEWMEYWRGNAERKQAKRQAMRHAG